MNIPVNDDDSVGGESLNRIIPDVYLEICLSGPAAAAAGGDDSQRVIMYIDLTIMVWGYVNDDLFIITFSPPPTQY